MSIYGVTFGEGDGPAVSGASFIGLPTVTYGATQIAGVGPNLLATDSVLGWPDALESTANASTLTLTDNGAAQTLTGSLGSITLIPGSAGFTTIDVNQSTAPSTTAFVNIRPDLSNLTCLAAQVIAGNFAQSANQTIRLWDAALNWANKKVGDSAGGFNGTIIGFGNNTFSVSPSVGSGTANALYNMSLTSPNIGNNTGSWTEVVTAFLGGPKRSISNPTVTASYTIEAECPTISATTQAGLYIKQRTAQQVATNRYGVLVDSHTSGTNRWSLWGSNKVHCDASDFIANASGFGFCNRDSQSSSAGGGGTARYWRLYADASATGVAGDVTLSIDSTGVVSASRAGGATGTVLLVIKDVGTAPVTT